MITTILRKCNNIGKEIDTNTYESLVAENVTVVEIDNIQKSQATDIKVYIKLEKSSNWKLYETIVLTETDALVLFDQAFPLTKVVAVALNPEYLIIKAMNIQGVI